MVCGWGSTPDPTSNRSDGRLATWNKYPLETILHLVVRFFSNLVILSYVQLNYGFRSSRSGGLTPCITPRASKGKYIPGCKQSTDQSLQYALLKNWGLPVLNKTRFLSCTHFTTPISNKYHEGNQGFTGCCVMITREQQFTV